MFQRMIFLHFFNQLLSSCVRSTEDPRPWIEPDLRGASSIWSRWWSGGNSKKSKRSSRKSLGLELAWNSCLTGGDDIEGASKKFGNSSGQSRVGVVGRIVRDDWRSLVGNQLRLEVMKGMILFSEIIQIWRFAILIERNKKKRGGGWPKYYA